jgi:hypothetical protein
VCVCSVACCTAWIVRRQYLLICGVVVKFQAIMNRLKPGLCVRSIDSYVIYLRSLPICATASATQSKDSTAQTSTPEC